MPLENQNLKTNFDALGGARLLHDLILNAFSTKAISWDEHLANKSYKNSNLPYKEYLNNRISSYLRQCNRTLRSCRIKNKFAVCAKSIQHFADVYEYDETKVKSAIVDHNNKVTKQVKKNKKMFNKLLIKHS